MGKQGERELLQQLLGETPRAKIVKNQFNLSTETQNIITVLSLIIGLIGCIIGLLGCIAAWIVVPRISSSLKLDRAHKAINATVIADQNFVISDTVITKTERLIVIELENIGDQEIREDDYRRPLVFIFPNGDSINKAKILDMSQNQSGAKINYRERWAALDKMLINPGDKFFVTLCIDDGNKETDKAIFAVDARIAGMDRPISLIYDVSQKYQQPEALCSS